MNPFNETPTDTVAPPDQPDAAARIPRVFISYRHTAPDQSVAKELFRALTPHYDVFLDRVMAVGTDWAARIEQELRQADFLISLLSMHSVGSEMVKAEIARAHELAQEGKGRPIILPVRLNYRERFHYPLSAYLDHIQWAFWSGPEDTPRLIAELQRAIAGGQLSLFSEEAKVSLLEAAAPEAVPQPLPEAEPQQRRFRPKSLVSPDQAVDPQSEFYIKRPSDERALAIIQQQGVTLTIKGPQQMGKSSLLMRTIEAALAAGKRVAYIDFQLIRESFGDAETFYRAFCTYLSESLEMENRTDEHWKQGHSSDANHCQNFIRDYLLKGSDTPLVLALDGVENLFMTPFQTEFLTMLRNTHERRGLPMPKERVWRRLDLIFVTSTEPYTFITDHNRSPFNVGEAIEVENFTPAHITQLNEKHGWPLTPDEELRLLNLLGGHPYLIRRALYLVASESITAEALFTQAAEDYGPFGDHLRHHLFQLTNGEKLVEGLRQVISRGKYEDNRVVDLLRGAGLLRLEGTAVKPRYQLYEDYFRRHLNV